MHALLLSLLVTAVDPALEQALQRALTRTPATVELQSWDAPRCLGRFVPAPFESSGRVPVRVRGKACEAWGWAQVKVIVPVATLSRDVKANEPMDGAWSVTGVEARGEVISALPPGATATRGLRRGMPVNATDFRVGPRPGTAITVRLVMGALSLEQRATISPCPGNGTCATLPSGKRVAGVWSDGQLVVEAP